MARGVVRGRLGAGHTVRMRCPEADGSQRLQLAETASSPARPQADIDGALGVIASRMGRPAA